MKDLLSERLQWGGKDQLYHVLDKLLAHRDALFTHLQERWQDLFGVKYDVLLYDLTSTYFEGEAEENPKAQRGYSRDHRPDCKQIVIALVVTPEGFPLAYAWWERHVRASRRPGRFGRSWPGPKFAIPSR